MSTKRKATAKAVMNESTITEEERRKLRKEQRKLQEDLQDNTDNLVSNAGAFKEKFEQLDNLYEKVHYAREANLDASNMEKFSHIVGKQAKDLSSSDLSKFHAQDLIKAALLKCHNDEGGCIDWLKLGQASGVCFRSVPEINFFFGSMDTEVVQKERTKRQRTTVLDCEEEAPEEYADKRRVDQQAIRLQHINDKLAQCKEPVSLFNLCFNPQSFSQTVENIFDISFLVRDNTIRLSKDNNGLPIVSADVQELGYSHGVPNQCIVTYDQKQYREILEIFGIKECIIGHRVTD